MVAAMTSDANAVFSRAEQSFRAGNYAAVCADLARIQPFVGENPALLHLWALAEGRAGTRDAAIALFHRALRAAPRDAQIHNNFANLLRDAGAAAEALKHFETAITLRPELRQARINRAILLLDLGRPGDACRDLDHLLSGDASDIGARLTRGAANIALRRPDAARVDFDHVLSLDPANSKALQGRARLAMEDGDTALAIRHYRTALAIAPDDAEIWLGLAEAIEAAGDDGSEAMLAAAVARQPRWRNGQDALARMRAEAGQGADFDREYRSAVAAYPDDQVLALGHVGCLYQADRAVSALASLDAAIARSGRSRATDLYEAMVASDAGLPDRAEAALARLGNDPRAALARGRHALRCGDPVRAAAALAPMVAADSDDVTAWAHLGLAWRMAGDARHAWLNEQPGLVAAIDLDIIPEELAALAELLRGLHRARGHPIGQSLRGGTQTRGRLLGRGEPRLQRISERLAEAVRAYQSRLPPRDAGHPLLRHRDAPLRFVGSWSVRLTEGGYHVAHIHPAGVLSSACYIRVPDSVDDVGHPGWLEVGGPPAELGLDLQPLRLIKPVPGRLVLFPSTMFHGTRPFPTGERLVIAFDVAAEASA